MYRAYVSREGPQALGSVQWPLPKKGALKGKKLLSTGVLETIEREALNQLLVDCSAHVMSTMSKKLDVLIVGRDAGPKKLQTAEEWGVKQMGEQEFFEFLTKTLDEYSEEDSASTLPPPPPPPPSSASPAKRPSQAGRQDKKKKRSKK